MQKEIKIHNSTKILFVVFFTIFIDMLGVGVLIPVFPLLVLPSSTFNVIPNTWDIKQGFILLGWISATFPFAIFLFAPILGQLSDKFGRKKIIAISISGTALSYALFAIGIITKNIPLMFISRFFDGCTGGNISVAQAVVADISDAKSRAKNFGLIGMAFGLGFIFGPFIGGELSNPELCHYFNAATPFYFTAFLSLLNMFSVLTFLPETLRVKSDKRINITKPFSNILGAFSHPGLRNIMPSTFFFNGGFTFFTTFFAVTLANKFGFNQGHIGSYFAYVGFMIALAQGLIVRRLSGKVNDYKVLRLSMFGTGICLLIYYVIPANNYAWLYLLPPFLATANALTNSFNASLVTRVSPLNIRGEALGISFSVMALAQTIPAILSGYIANIHPSMPILIGGFTVIFGGVCFFLFFNPKKFEELKT